MSKRIRKRKTEKRKHIQEELECFEDELECIEEEKLYLIKELEDNYYDNYFYEKLETGEK
jgi:guanylate kinase